MNGCSVAGGRLLLAVIAPLAKVLLTRFFTFGPQLVAEVVPGTHRAATLSWVRAFATRAGIVLPVLLGNFVNAATGARAFETGVCVTGALLVAAGAAGFAWLRPTCING
ncbi:hypothetical protein [Paraburkholderia hiiakae]|uniref:hypothetical protein n=1 Tax=Paraburkholderia hiiakae TaxID=1081782 RepID=UPI00191B0919|nr:hypothetical protein [Paraburkholderia hiiakae]